MTTIQLVVPEGFADPGRPSGGNVYDARLAEALRARGLEVSVHEAAAASLDERLAELPSGALVVVDGLVGSAAPGALEAHRARLTVLLLVHLPLGVPVPGVGTRVDDERRAVDAVAAVVTTSRWTKGWLATTYGVPESRLHVALPGVEPAPLTEPTAAGSRLLSVGAVTPVKGHDVLVAALALLADHDWSWSLVGSAVDRCQAEAVWSAACASGLDGRIRLAGALTGPGLAAAYAEADLLVLPSRHETYGLVAVEALAHGVPVLAADVGGVREALGRAADGAAPGLLVPADEPPALAAALREWWASADLRASLRAAAASRRETLRRWSDTAADVARLLDEPRSTGDPGG